MQRLFLIFFCLATLTGFSQELLIDWGPENSRNSQLIEVLPDDGMDFYAYRLSGGQFVQTPRVTHYYAGEAVTTKRIEQRIEDNMVNLEELATFNGQLLGFFSDKKGGINSLYMVKYDTEVDPYDDPELMVSYPMPKGWSNRGFFNVIVSNNRCFMCVEYVIPGKRDLFDRYGYKVVDSTFNVITEGEYEIPYSSRDATVELRYLTDEGDYILGMSVYANHEAGMWKDNTLEKTVVVHVKGNELSEYEIAIDEMRVFDIGVSALDSMLTVTGTYGPAFSTGAQGVFLQRIDLSSKTIVNEYFKEFPRDFMTQNLTTEQLDRLERREERGRLGPQLYNYAIRAIHPLPDGSTVVLAEQFYIYQQNASDARGISQTAYHYYYNDLIAYKIDAGGTFNWIVQLPKEQHSVNDNGYYSSVMSFISNGKLCCLFNDNLKNYDEFRNYEGFYRTISFPVRKKSYALALGQIDLQTGEIRRTVFNDYQETNGVVVLRLSSLDNVKRELLLFSSGNRERFGLLRF